MVYLLNNDKIHGSTVKVCSRFSYIIDIRIQIENLFSYTFGLLLLLEIMASRQRQGIENRKNSENGHLVFLRSVG